MIKNCFFYLCRTLTWEKKINFTNFFPDIAVDAKFGYFEPQWIDGTAHKIPIVKWHSANEHIRRIGHTVKSFYNFLTQFWDQSKKSLERSAPPVPTPILSSDAASCSYTNAWKQCAICFIFMRLKRRSFLMTQTKPILMRNHVGGLFLLLFISRVV